MCLPCIVFRTAVYIVKVLLCACLCVYITFSECACMMSLMCESVCSVRYHSSLIKYFQQSIPFTIEWQILNKKILGGKY